MVERTKDILELPKESRDWKNLLQDEHLQLSHLWSSTKFRQEGTFFPSSKYLTAWSLGRISVERLYGVKFFDPITSVERAFADDIMSAKRKGPINITDPAEFMRAKKKKKSKQGQASTSEGRTTRVPTREVVSEPVVSNAGTTPIRTPFVSSSRTPGRGLPVDIDDGAVTVSFPSGSSSFGEVDKMMPVIDSLRLPEDSELLRNKRGPEVADWGTARLFQLLQIHLHMKDEIQQSSQLMQNLRKAASNVKSELEEKKREVTSLQYTTQQAKEELEKTRVESERKDAEIDSLKRQLDAANAKIEESKAEIEELTDEVNVVAAKAMLQTKATLMQEYKEGKHVDWVPDKAIAEWEEFMDEDAPDDVERVEAAVDEIGTDVEQANEKSLQDGDQRDGSTTDAGGRIDDDESAYQAE